ncbi:MAG: chitosanase [Desulfovibrio sp.]|jgi:hypothetical protein|nr:chitosanase [Desulfovibrio sp.]
MSFSSFPVSPEQTREKQSFVPRRPSPGIGAGFAALMAGKNIQAQKVDAAPAATPAGPSKENGNVTLLRAPILAGRVPSDMARSMRGAKQGGVESSLPGFSIDSYMRTRVASPRDKVAPKKAEPAPEPSWEESLGSLSASFESGRDGSAAIGYDRVGGTSYGKYQIASRVGGMKDFVNFLDGNAPDIAKRLRGAGPANTGSRRGEMPKVWQAIAREQPERFEKLQEAFIRESHYKPAVKAIEERTALKAGKLSPVMREVIWSTAVQHGPTGAARIFDKADNMSGKPADPGYERKLIQNVYALRAGQFGSSDENIQAAVGRRFVREKMLALNMLDGGRSSALA